MGAAASVGLLLTADFLGSSSFAVIPAKAGIQASALTVSHNVYPSELYNALRGAPLSSAASFAACEGLRCSASLA